MKKLNVDGYIIEEMDRWLYDYFEVPHVTLNIVRAFLEDAKNDDIELVINCFGGDVWTAASIYAELRAYKGNSTSRIIGISASASSFMMLGTQKVIASPMATIMIHNAQSMAAGDYREMEHTAEILRQMDKTIINAYEIKTGKKREDLAEFMDNETWMTAQDALSLGIIDEIDLKEGEKLSDAKQGMVMASASKIAACFNPTRMHAMAIKLKEDTPINENGEETQPVSDMEEQKKYFRNVRKKLNHI
jgi:ATP-dependent Clp endopeptidase proteolytic subunit ClpP